VEITDHDVDYDVNVVTSDYHAATTEIMSYLLSLHHRKIGMIYGVASPVLAEDRMQSYEENLKKNGLPVNQELIARCGPTIEDGYQAALRLLKLPERATAIIAINDLLAIGALRAAGDMGLHIPEELSLVGFDDIQVAKYLVPRLTTVAKDSIRVGREAVKLLLAQIIDPRLHRQKLYIPSRLIIRESTGSIMS
jgi:DNA-binding LacI/PurR family transcriptional regulator